MLTQLCQARTGNSAWCEAERFEACNHHPELSAGQRVASRIQADRAGRVRRKWHFPRNGGDRFESWNTETQSYQPIGAQVSPR